jgi:thiol-disulfide isomerase/thioredoxin
MGFIRHLIIVALVTLGASPVGAQDGDLVYAMYFRSDWCPNCRILEPNLHSARQASSDLPVGYVVVDLSANDHDYEIVLYDLLDKGLARHYNQYLGLTGFVMFVASDTSEVIDCVTRLNDADEIVQIAARAVDAVRTTQPGERSPNGLDMCPPPLRDPPPQVQN